MVALMGRMSRCFKSKQIMNAASFELFAILMNAFRSKKVLLRDQSKGSDIKGNVWAERAMNEMVANGCHPSQLHHFISHIKSVLMNQEQFIKLLAFILE